MSIDATGNRLEIFKDIELIVKFKSKQGNTMKKNIFLYFMKNIITGQNTIPLILRKTPSYHWNGSNVNLCKEGWWERGKNHLCSFLKQCLPNSLSFYLFNPMGMVYRIYNYSTQIFLAHLKVSYLSDFSWAAFGYQTGNFDVAKFPSFAISFATAFAALTDCLPSE